MSANVCNWEPPPPLKTADVLCGWPLRQTAYFLIQSLLESLKKQTYDQWPEKSHRPGLFKSPINSDLVLDSMISPKHAKEI